MFGKFGEREQLRQTKTIQNVACTLHSNWIVHQFTKLFLPKPLSNQFRQILLPPSISTIRHA